MSGVLPAHTKKGVKEREAVLILGAEGTSKHELSKTLIEVAPPLKLQIHTATRLPLETPRYIDFICFIIHIANKLSFDVLRDSLQQVDISYFLGKSLIIVNTKGKQLDEGIPSTDLLELGNQYGVTVIFRNLELAAERLDAARKLRMMITLSAGLISNVSPLLVEAVGVEGNLQQSNLTLT